MPINPLRPLTNFDVPTYPAGNARAPESAFNNIASIGENIGAYRLRNQIADLISSAGVDEHGNVNEARALSALARAGLVSPEQLATMGYRQQALQRQQDTLDIARQRLDLEKRSFDEPTYTVTPPDPVLGGGSITEQRRGQFPIIRPHPGVTPGPQSELEMPGAARVVAAGAQDRLPANFYPQPGGPPTPSEGPPYRVAQAGPLTVAPTPAATPPATGRNEDYLRTLPTEGFRQLVRDIAEYKTDPTSIDPKYRTQALIAASRYRPDYNQAEYQKRGAPVGGEVAGRTGLAKSYLDIYPDIKRRIEADELNTLAGRAAAQFGQGYPGELVGAIKEGAESLLRGLTGAGMNKDEAADYAKRYGINWFDTKETQRLKIRGLDRALRYVTTEVGRGRGGEDFLKDYRSQFGAPLEHQERAARVPDNAARYLQANPATRDAFDAKYGAGAADRVLGARR